MHASSSLNFPHQQHHLFLRLFKYPSPTDGFGTNSTTLASPFRAVIQPDHLICLLPPAGARAGILVEKRSNREHTHVERSMVLSEMGDGPSSLKALDGRNGRKWRKDEGNDGRRQGHMPRREGYRRNREIGSSVFPSVRSRNEKVTRREETNVGRSLDSMELREMGDGSSPLKPRSGRNVDRRLRKDGELERYEARKHGNVLRSADSRRNTEMASSVSPSSRFGVDSRGANSVSEARTEKKGKKSKINKPEFELRVGLDMCSKNGDVMGGLSLYDSALKENIKLDQYHYSVLLYLCSSAAAGVVRPGKSGSSTNGNSFTESGLNDASEEDFAMALCDNGSSNTSRHVNDGIRVGEDVMKYAITRGFEIYEKTCSEKVPLNEAALTSVARMAMAMGNGDMAFEIIKEIKSLGLTLRLRSYGPALFTFCNKGEIDKAFEVEKHMQESGLSPEEPELAALLKVSIEASKSDRVYYLLQKLRTSERQVSPSTAELIETWFKSSTASRVGKRKWDMQLIEKAMENGGGGWHGLGWLGKGKWSVAHTDVDTHGFCQRCNEKLVAIDIDPIETENFSKSVASIAANREKHFNFQNFQKWLDYYGPYEAVIDAANIGLFSQRQFSVTKVNAVVNGIRQILPSKKWPLIVVHNRRIHGGKMDELANKKLIEKWKNADALYATPTGSNDDWYWLYAAVNCKALIVTNDEMRDHIFQVLGNDFFPKWKERHQVRFSFHDGSPEFYMPPACSVVIQESKEGHWHIPISSEERPEGGRSGTWLCVMRTSSLESRQGSLFSQKEHVAHQPKISNAVSDNRPVPRISGKTFATNRTLQLESIVPALDAAEKFSGHVINFSI